MPSVTRQPLSLLVPLALLGVLGTGFAGVAFADEGHETEDDAADMEEVVVEGRRQVLVGEARSASEGIIGQSELALRPILRPGDVLEAVPGLIITQHSGSGKSNQMFLRGFNLDHGTDFATWIDGMPVNMRTHGHGQGYTDLNFLIPETIRTIEFVKGPYHAELGDFSSAGGAHITTFDDIPDDTIRVGLGEDGFSRLLVMGDEEIGDLEFTGALEGQVYDGPWVDIEEDVQKINGMARIYQDDGSHRWALTGMFYDNEWNSADQIPARAVEQGLIDILGSIDTTLGGDSSRYSLSWDLSHDRDGFRDQWNAYVIGYDMNLWSNFTYLLDDPENGDQFQQVDDRTIWGGAYRRFWQSGASSEFTHTAGAEVRYDDIGEVGLYRTRERERLSTVREDTVDQASIGIYYELEWRFAEQWRTVLGIRGDYYWFDVESDNPVNSGDDDDSIVSPKASLIYTFNDTTEGYLSAGFGFHSNDARGTTITIDPGSGEAVDPVDPLVQSFGAEVGLKTVWLDSWNASIALWYLELDSELLFVGDAGTTEASGASERYGIEFNNFWVLNDVWILEADFAWTESKFSDEPSGEDEIPGALPFVASGAITAEYPSGWFGSFRVRYFDGAPLIEDGSVEGAGSTMANLSVGWGNDRWRVQADVLNLFDSDDKDIEYFYASRLPGEPADGIEDIHFHVFEPRQFRLHASLFF
ncbi:MAG: TonB-dependent receptor [Pseudomonadota bacterium]